MLNTAVHSFETGPFPQKVVQL